MIFFSRKRFLITYLSAAILPHKIFFSFYITVLNPLHFTLADIQKGTNYIPVLVLGHYRWASHEVD